MSEHTPGRIQLAKEFDGHIMTMDGLAVSDCCLDYSSLDHDQQVSNARRLVACWNACDGITDPENVVPRLLALNERVPDLQHQAATLRVQRDELLAALEMFVAWTEAENNHEGTTFWQQVEMLRELDAAAVAAIAKVKGGAV